jgi:hypothetical protein
VCLNRRALERPSCDFLAVLAHQAVHQFQEQQTERNDPRHYHNRDFLARADRIGIPTKSGFHCGFTRLDERFLALLQELGIDPAKPIETKVVSKPAQAARPKWSCGCTTVWATRLNAVCRTCNRDFATVDRG